jgi:nucleotide sugar dehydrogenase
MKNIGVVGCGKLGICYSAIFARAGYRVYCYDINNRILDDIINDNYNYSEPMLNSIIKNNKENLIITRELQEVINNSDLIFTFIQTPSLNNGSYDHSYIDEFINNCISFGYQTNKKTIVISSTVMPGYCKTALFKIKDYNYDICYNPSFISQGSIIANIVNPDIVLIGNDTEADNNDIINIHKSVIENNSKIKVMSLLEAEITKISINCYITMKITYANLIGDLSKSLDCNPTVILDAICSDSRIGNAYFKYGYGFGGPCLPRDNKALFYYFNNNITDPNINLDICNIIDKNNKNHLSYQFDELKNKTDPIEFTYITYKDSSDIIEESQKLLLAIKLADYGKEVIIYERPEIINILKDKYPNLKFIVINPTV